ncbi:hypothetical protein OIV83_004567 [Microbotryomycetes sp. JL201]|nr:hypothetical protein OIV83_004567 [Microbotryomycetes sp. JL201]
MVRRAALLIAAFASLAAAAPLDDRGIFDQDAGFAYTKPEDVKLTCPNGIQGKAGGIVFLIHGTASNGQESWAKGPYVQVLPNKGKGYDVCWIDLPARALNDAQISGELVARAIPQLASQSATGKINIIGHSQGGGLNPQWALTFWPSTRQYVQNYIALAGDFKGTALGYFLTVPQFATESIIQQTVPSRYLTAQNNPLGGGKALVPTTSIYTVTDDIVQPQFPRAVASSNLPGASVHALQDLDFCGPAKLADHFTMLVDSAAYGLAFTTLEAGKPVPISAVDKGFCLYNIQSPETSFDDLPAAAYSGFVDAISVGVAPKASREPPLKPYVCRRGYALNCGN